MPAQPNILPAVQLTPFRVDGEQDTNNGVGRQISHANQPWTLRLQQTVTQQTNFANTANIEIGWDVLTYPVTYRAVGNNIYSLRYNAVSSWPYTEVVVPSYGYYDIYGMIALNTAPGGAVTQMVANIKINGTVSTQKSVIVEGAGGTGQFSCDVRDTRPLNPADIITLNMFQENANGATLTAVSDPTTTYMIIRYLGLS